MLYRYILSSLFCVNLLFSGDPSNNPDTMGGKWVGQLPNSSGTTSLVAPGAIPKGPDLNPQYQQPTPPNNNSSGWGLLGFIGNLIGGNSKKERARTDALDSFDKADKLKREQMAMSDHDLAQFYPGAAEKRAAAKQAQWFADMAKQAPIIQAPVVAPSPILPSSAMTCRAPANFDSSGPIPYNPTQYTPKFVAPSSAPSVPNVGSLVSENPFKGLSGPQSGGGAGVGEVMQGVGTVVALGAGIAANTAVPVAATTTAGGAVAGGVLGGAAVVVATPWIPIIAIGTAGGLFLAGTVIATHEFFARPVDGIFFKKAPSAIPQHTEPITYAQIDQILNPHKLQNIIQRRANAGNGGSNSSSGNNAPNPSSNPNPQKPDDNEKKRRIQPLSKTEAYAKIKDRYEHFEGNKYRIRDGKEPIKVKGKAVERVEWDHNHGGEWEAYPKKKGGEHMGALDPETLELYKPPVIGRKVKD